MKQLHQMRCENGYLMPLESLSNQQTTVPEPRLPERLKTKRRNPMHSYRSAVISNSCRTRIDLN